MAGHSHWAGIKHKKAALDKKRGKAFGKFSKAIMIAAREGGGDPAANLSLRYAIDRARSGNMPKDAIERAIKKATGEFGDVVYEEIMYEGYASDGVAVMVDVLTDNRNRTAPEMRRLFSVSGGSLANPGSVKFQFEQKGLIVLDAEGLKFDEVFEVAAEAGAEDVENNGDEFGITTPPTEFHAVRQALEDKGWEPSSSEIMWISENMVEPPADAVARIEKLLEALDDHDDVQNVYSNYQAPETAEE